ncbi:zinc finger protein BRUTUS-like At1g74770 [Cucurbita moschata]|uniref:Zinc finger protein BRUTUS-like At1g74770 n=1 Tax=Cucurbita moschata TaxID=3662 RepID=A0A6J1E4B0_CUCMO|nr:zinc finger protein BRUTUS-like At1g74770 [Cucurbita moschata]
MDGATAASLDRSSHANQYHETPEAPEDFYADSGLSHLPLAEAPVLVLIKFHTALRSELADLRRVTLAAAESGCYGREFVSELIRRVEFLKLAYKYHCAAEDEVVFPALDVHTKNVISTYSLEHESLDGLFTSISEHCEEINAENKDISKPFQELVFCLGTIQTTICQHMIKEEQQVFPLLIKQFSAREQASLVWQFICSVPMILLEELLPWMMSFLPSEQQSEVVICLRDVVPNEKLLQEVIMSWLGNSEAPCRDVEAEGMKVHSSQDSGQSPVDSLHLWHGAIMKDLKEVLKCLFQLKSCTSTALSNLDSLVVQIRFLADVILFYRKALEKFFRPVFNQYSDAYLISSDQAFLSDSHIEALQRLLQHGAHDTIPLSNFLEKLCWDMESFVVRVSKQFTFQETKVLPVIRKSCSHKTQQQLLYMSLRTLPLGLLKCIVSWFSTHLSEEEMRSVLHTKSKGDLRVNNALVALLHEWLRIGYSGKTSVEQFGQELQKIFQTRSYLLHGQVDQMKGVVGTLSLSSNVQSHKGSNSEEIGLLSNNKNKGFMSHSSPDGSCTASMYGTSYSSGINLQIHFPGTVKVPCPYTKHLYEERPHSAFNQPKPIDLIFFFHKALKKELDYFVLGSAKMVENVGILTEFIRRFQLVKYLYQIHTDAEDQIAFPALEKKGKFQNISYSYSIDHKLEVHQFSTISLILNEMSELHASIFYGNTDRKMFGHRQLCLELHDMCKSLHKSLSDHVDREEIELWPLFREFFSIEEQEKLIGAIFGRTKAEILQDMIPWQMAYLTPSDQHDMMSMFHKVTRNTMFNEWLREWWEGYDHERVTAEVTTTTPSLTSDPLEIISKYLSTEVTDVCEGNVFGKPITSEQNEGQWHATDVEKAVIFNLNDETKDFDGSQRNKTFEECTKLVSHGDVDRDADVITEHMIDTERPEEHEKSIQHNHLLTISQEDLEAAIRRVSRDSSLDSKTKSYMIQNLLMSRWNAKHHTQLETNVTTESQGFAGQYPSYKDSLKKEFGCKHYKRNCKLLAPCCNQLHTCIHCHDETTDHSLDRKSITKMMCMNCLVVQPIGKTCSTVSCGNLSMGKYFCKICKLFDDSRDIYHCPYCNLCRVGKGLGIDYFHCMNCNACMSRALSVHVCREKCLEDNCPICHEYIFTSTLPVKSLPCGHLMHSACFQEYTYTHYTCPICSKSLGDMQVYFEMLDALLAEEKIPDEYSGKTQVILCNDCEKRGMAAFHWLYHKCPCCGSYNTRVL